MLVGFDFAALDRVALFHRRQATAFFFFHAFDRIVAVFAIEREKAVEHQGLAGGAQADLAVGRRNLDRDLVEHGAFHLRRDGALPDQLVEARGVASR